MDPVIAAELELADAGEQRLFVEMAPAQELMTISLRDLPSFPA